MGVEMGLTWYRSVGLRKMKWAPPFMKWNSEVDYKFPFLRSRSPFGLTSTETHKSLKAFTPLGVSRLQRILNVLKINNLRGLNNFHHQEAPVTIFVIVYDPLEDIKLLHSWLCKWGDAFLPIWERGPTTCNNYAHCVDTRLLRFRSPSKTCESPSIKKKWNGFLLREARAIDLQGRRIIPKGQPPTTQVPMPYWHVRKGIFI